MYTAPISRSISMHPIEFITVYKNKAALKVYLKNF